MPKTLDDFQLLQRYVEICNQAIANAGGESPSARILDAGLAQVASPVIVDVIDDRPKPCGQVSVDGQDITFTSLDADNISHHWTIRRRFLEDVVAAPDAYLQEPAMLDWGWVHTPAASSQS